MFITFAQVALYLLGESKHLTRCLLRLAKDDGIHELVGGLKTPRFRLDERRLAGDLPHPVVYQADGSFQVLSAITQIRAQSEIYLVTIHFSLLIFH